MKKIDKISDLLKTELDSFFFQYSTSKPETIHKAVEVLEYARDILTEVRTPEDIFFDIDKERDYQKIQVLKEELKLSKFFEVLDFFLAGSLNSKTQELTQKEKELYLKCII